MCGIFFCYCHSGHCDEAETGKPVTEAKFTKELYDLLNDPVLERRGPNVSKHHRLSCSSQCLQGWMRGCVLHLRGHMTPQPLTDDKGNALLWNGEIFDGIKVLKDENDTQVFFQRLVKCETDEDVLKTMEQVHGPWAFIFWQVERKILWFGRDVFGRRSLLWHLPTSSSELLVLTSVAMGNLDYTEVPSVGIFALDLSGIDNVISERSSPPGTYPVITLHPWHRCKWPGTTQSVLGTPEHELASFLTPNKSPSVVPILIDKNEILKYWIPDINKSLSGSNNSLLEEKISADDNGHVHYLENILKENASYRLLSEKLVTVLEESVRRRVNNLPDDHEPVPCSECPNVSKAQIAVLFSGGLDSSILAALLDRCLPPDEPIDLLNVAFEQTPPACGPVKGKHKQKKHGKNKNKSRFINQEVPNNSSPSFHCGPNSSNTSTENPYTQTDVLSASSYKTCNILNSCDGPMCEHGEKDCENTFDSKCHLKETCESSLHSQAVALHDPYDVPDRRTGHIALSELNPHRKWNFIEINVSQKELQTMRSLHVGKLIYPLQTVLDDSIGCAVWFASKGSGRLANHERQAAKGSGRLENCKEQPIVSGAKVILCGMAADELFAGYSRHRAHFFQHGEESLVKELEKEIWRISARNLGRDDRIIADHGKEARFPFLDEHFTKFVSDIPVHVRANLHLPRGLGEKLLLRLAAFTLGLRQTACQPKRAIQFGSKIAKLDDSKEKGSDICSRLL